jgi:hypothetical protein
VSKKAPLPHPPARNIHEPRLAYCSLGRSAAAIVLDDDDDDDDKDDWGKHTVMIEGIMAKAKAKEAAKEAAFEASKEAAVKEAVDAKEREMKEMMSTAMAERASTIQKELEKRFRDKDEELKAAKAAIAKPPAASTSAQTFEMPMIGARCSTCGANANYVTIPCGCVASCGDCAERTMEGGRSAKVCPSCNTRVRHFQLAIPKNDHSGTNLFCETPFFDVAAAEAQVEGVQRGAGRGSMETHGDPLGSDHHEALDDDDEDDVNDNGSSSSTPPGTQKRGGGSSASDRM